MKQRIALLALILMLAAILMPLGLGSAAGTVNLTFGPALAAPAKAIPSTAQAFVGTGSWQANPAAGVNKFETYLDPTQPPFNSLGAFTVDDIDSITYRTYSDDNPRVLDIYMVIYTSPVGCPHATHGSFYCHRLIFEPTYAANRSTGPNQWTTWTTVPGANELTGYDSQHSGTFGFYGEPTFADYQAGAINWPAEVGSGSGVVDYGPETVSLISFQSGSGAPWVGYDGYVDALTIDVNGNIVNVDLEAGASTVWVDDSWVGTTIGTDPDGAGPATSFGYDAFATIPDGVNGVTNNGTVNVLAGTYTAGANIANRTNVTITGASAATVLVQPTAPASLFQWLRGSTPSRLSAFRIVDSTGITLENVTVDMDLVKAANRGPLLSWDSSNVTIENNIFKNASIAGTPYTELGLAIYTTGPTVGTYSLANRATATVTGNTFTNSGRVALLTHWFVDVTISNNTFEMPIADFGYGIEMGSTSIGSITNNTFTGFNTYASDGSGPGAIYIENAFTNPITLGSAVAKPVTISGNTLDDNTQGIVIGNQFNGLAGDVDINVTLNTNTITNSDWGLVITDEDRAAGSSVTVTGYGNNVSGSRITAGDPTEVAYGPTYIGQGNAYSIYGVGDANVTVDLDGGNIVDNDYGVTLGEFGAPAGSLYNVDFNFNRLADNTVGADLNAAAAGFGLNMENNWWGCNTGPNTAGCDTLTGSTGSIDANPWLTLTLTPAGSLTCVPAGSATGTYSVSVLTNSDAVVTSPANIFSTTVDVTPSAGSASPDPITLVNGGGSTLLTVPSSSMNVTLSATLDSETLVSGSLNAPACTAPLFTSANAATFIEGTFNTFNVTASGSPAPTFSITSGTLPTGVTLSPSGVLSGTPANGTMGTYPVTITATNGINPNATQNFTLTVLRAATVAEPVGNTSCAKLSSTVNIKIRGMVAGRQYTTTMEVRDGTTTYMLRQSTSTFAGPTGSQINLKWVIFPYNNVPALATPAYNPAWTTLPGPVTMMITVVDRTTGLQSQTTMTYTCSTGAVSMGAPVFTQNVTTPPYAP